MKRNTAIIHIYFAFHLRAISLAPIDEIGASSKLLKCHSLSLLRTWFTFKTMFVLSNVLFDPFSLSKIIKKFSGSTAQLAHCGWSGKAELVAQHYSNYFKFATSYIFNIIQNFSYIQHDPEYFIFSHHLESYIYQLVYHRYRPNNKDLWHCNM